MCVYVCVWCLTQRHRRGIQVLRTPSLADLTPPTAYAIQRYIARPLLLPLNRRKFDLRIYVLALGWEPHPHVLLYREGLVRFAAVEYVCTGETLKDLSVHLWYVHHFAHPQRAPTRTHTADSARLIHTTLATQ